MDADEGKGAPEARTPEARTPKAQTPAMHNGEHRAETRGGVAPESRTTPTEVSTTVTVQFIRELIIFFAGLMLGFFWYMYYGESKSEETHIIIGLLVIIICLARYLFLIRRG